MAEVITDPKAQKALFVVMAMAFFLDGLDGTIVTIALPEIAREFGMSTGESSWIVTVYFMMMAGLILVFGKLADMGWIKRILVSGFVVFAVSSLACGLSTGMASLLVFRAVQGVGSAMLAATGILLVVKYLPINMRHFGMSLSVLGSFFGAAFGPVIGGVLTDYLVWSWIFFINVPVGLICAVFSVKAVPSDTGFDRTAPFDYTGSVLLFLAMIFGLYSVEAFPSEGVTVVTAGALAAFAILFALFLVHCRRTDHPVLDLTVFRLPRFVSATVVFLILNACFMGMLYLVPFLMRVELGFDTVTSGMLMLIQAIVTLALCIPVGRLCDEHGTHLFAVIGCLALVGTFSIFMMVDDDAGSTPLILGLVVLGTVWGFSGASVGPRMVENVPEDKNGTATSLMSFFVYFGSAFGTALFSALFNIGSESDGVSIDAIPPSVFMDGFGFVMICGLVMSIMAVAISWRLKDAVEKS